MSTHETTAPKRSRESRWAWAWLVSLLLHALALFGLWRDSQRRSVEAEGARDSKPLQVTIVTLPPAPKPVEHARPAAAQEPMKQEAKKPQSSKAKAVGKAPNEEAAPPRLELSADPPGMNGAPLQRPRLSLLPSDSLPGLGQDTPAPSMHGRTVYNDGGAEEGDAEWQAMRAEATVQRWAKGAFAESRAQRGIVSPYYYDMRSKLQDLTGKPPPFHPEPSTPQGKLLQGIWGSWAGARERYGKTGQPYATPEGYRAEFEVNPRIAEMADKGDELAGQVRAQLLARARLRDLGEGRMGVELEARVELRQGSDGSVKSTTLLQSSGSKSFDAFVVERTPLAVGSLVDAGVLDVGKERSTIWAFIGSISYYHSMDEATSVKDKLWAQTMSALLGSRFEEMTGTREYIDLSRPVYNCRVKLIAVDEE